MPNSVVLDLNRANLIGANLNGTRSQWYRTSVMQISVTQISEVQISGTFPGMRRRIGGPLKGLQTSVDVPIALLRQLL